MTTDLLDAEALLVAHDRAVRAISTHCNCKPDEATEVVESITALVFETLKHYLPGEDSCN